VERRGVAVHVEFEKAQTLKPGYHISGSRVETRRFRALWAKWIQVVTAPHLVRVVRQLDLVFGPVEDGVARGVALQVAF
jgi:hypothetical protein